MSIKFQRQEERSQEKKRFKEEFDIKIKNKVYINKDEFFWRRNKKFLFLRFRNLLFLSKQTSNQTKTNTQTNKNNKKYLKKYSKFGFSSLKTTKA